MTLQVTAVQQQLSSDFKAAAQAGNVADAFNLLQGLSLTNGLISCLELAQADRAALDTLAQRTSPMNRSLFCVRLIKDGFVPQDFYAEVTSNIEYHFARIIILRARTEHKKLVETLWPPALGPASTKLFYPELVRANHDRRTRICDIAERHVDIGPDHPRQIALFSLGSLFDYALAKAGTHPTGGGTTCILFFRSVLHTAGYNVIAPQTFKQICSVPKGVGELPQKFQSAKVPATELDNGKWPQPGDIFHIRGGNYRDKKGDLTNTDSTHVGIIIKVEGDLWHTIEGGASDHVTRRHTRKVVAVPGDKKEALKHGKWTFQDDIGLTSADSDRTRPIQGWFDISKIGDEHWMVGA